MRIGEPLQLPHEAGELRPPLALDERRDVASGAVLGLERAVVLVDDERDDVVHERVEPRDVSGSLSDGVIRKCRLPADAWPKIDAGVAVPREQRLQIERAVGQPLGREADVLEDERRAGGRAPPTDASRPLRTFQNCAASAGSTVNSAGSSRVSPARVGGPGAPAPSRATLGLAARNSTSSPVAVSGSARQRSGTPGLPSTARSDARSSSSTAAAPRRRTASRRRTPRACRERS